MVGVYQQVVSRPPHPAEVGGELHRGHLAGGVGHQQDGSPGTFTLAQPIDGLFGGGAVLQGLLHQKGDGHVALGHIRTIAVVVAYTQAVLVYTVMTSRHGGNGHIQGGEGLIRVAAAGHVIRLEYLRVIEVLDDHGFPHGALIPAHAYSGACAQTVVHLGHDQLARQGQEEYVRIYVRALGYPLHASYLTGTIGGDILPHLVDRPAGGHAEKYLEGKVDWLLQSERLHVMEVGEKMVDGLSHLETLLVTHLVMVSVEVV